MVAPRHHQRPFTRAILTIVPLAIVAAALAIPFAIVRADADDDAEAAADPDPVVYTFEKSGKHPLDPILDRIAEVRGERVIADPQLEGSSIHVGTAGGFRFHELNALLDTNNVRLVWTRGPRGALRIHAIHRRNLLEQLVAAPRVLGPDDEIPEVDELVELHIPIRHGNGNEIFAILRGILTRHPDRIGNILYIRGQPERLILVDLATQVRRYAEAIARLDTPAPAHRVLVEVWAGPRSALSGLAELAPAEASKRLRELAEGHRGVSALGETVHDVGTSPSNWERTGTVDGRYSHNEVTVAAGGSAGKPHERFDIQVKGELRGGGSPDSQSWRLGGSVPARGGSARIFVDLSPDEAGPSLAIVARVVELDGE